TDGAMGVEGLADGKGRRVPLPVAGGDIVAHDIAKHVLPGVLDAHVLRRLSDDDAKLNLVIQLFAHAGVGVVERAYDAARLLVEPELVGGRGGPKALSLLQVLAIVHP